MSTALGAPDTGGAHIRLTVLFSPAPRHVHEWALSVPTGTVLVDALAQIKGLGGALAAAGMAPDPRQCVCGLWGRLAPLDTVLRDLDRIEVYRPLKVDPKLARRERFHKQGRRSAGLFTKKQLGNPAAG